MNQESTFHEEDISIYPAALMTLAQHPQCFGRMNDPTSSAYMKGPCGDEMEFYLDIRDDLIADVRFYTKGCISTLVCGSQTAEMVVGKTVYDALAVSPKTIMDQLAGLPQERLHCTILAVSTLYKAIADYLLKP